VKIAYKVHKNNVEALFKEMNWGNVKQHHRETHYYNSDGYAVFSAANCWNVPTHKYFKDYKIIDYPIVSLPKW
jgi:hypothetical protein